MKDKLIDIMLIICFVALFVTFALMLFVEPRVKKAEPQKNTYYDVVLECQRLSASQVNNNWNYKNCLEELGKALDTGKILKI